MLRRPLPLLLLAAACASTSPAAAPYERGWALADKGDHAAALKELDEAIRLDPGHAKAWRARAGCRAGLQDLPGALRDLDRAIELAPDDALAYFNRSVVRHQAGDTPGARRDLDRSIALDPKSVEAWSNRGALRLMTGDPAGALEDLTHATRLADPLPQTLHNLGRAYQVSNRLAEAVEAFTKAIEKGAGAKSWAFRGGAKAAAGDAAGGRQDVDKALALEPGSSEVHLCDGQFKETAGDLPGALAAYTKAVELDPRGASPLRARSTLHLRAGRLDEAIDDLTRAYALQPQAVAERLAMALGARAQARINQGATLKAMPDIERSLKVAPAGWKERHASLTLRGRVRTGFGDMEGAAEDYREALRLAPADWEHRPLLEGLLKEVQKPRPWSLAMDLEGAFLICETRDGTIRSVVIGLVPAEFQGNEEGLQIKIGGVTMTLAGNAGMMTLLGPGGRQAMTDLPAAWGRDLARRFREEQRVEPGITLRKWLADEVRVYPAPALEKFLEAK